MVELEAAEALFPTPLFRFRVPGAEALNARLVDEIARLRASDPGIARSNRNGWHSGRDFFGLTDPGFVELRGHVVEAVRQATLQASPRFELGRWQLQLEGWVNVLGQHGFNAPHDHPAFVWSGAYYVTVPPGQGDSGMFEAFDPRTNVRYPMLEGAACFHDSRKLRPAAGSMLIFPSYLRHWVFPNEEAADRISIAFNARYALRR
jgi:uncharacterized protein (TIGR02466 family)